MVENLRVLAIDPADTKAAAGGNGFGRTVTLEVTPEQAEQINVAGELGKLSLTLRSLGANDVIATATTASGEGGRVRPVWAGDVSPALGATPASKTIPADPPRIEVIRGTKVVLVKPQ